MCGRTCLTLQPSEIAKACKYDINVNGPNETDKKEPEYRAEYNLGKQYVPSYNIAPTDITPVLVSAAHFDESPSDQMLVTMMWGIIPFWHQGDYRKHGLTTNNCRLESMLESKLYKHSFQRGQRCVILAEAFYEWQTTKNVKSSQRDAYYIYMPQKEGVVMHDKSTWPTDKSLNLLKIAGLFDIWTDHEGNNMFSYTVITFESDEKFSWLHHRSPAVLETEQQVADWLDYKRVPNDKALACIKPPSKIVWYQVSNAVNNSRNKSDQCNKPKDAIKNEEKSIPKKRSLLDSWLISKKSKKEEQTNT